MVEYRDNTKRAGLACVALAVLTLAVFWRVQGFDFVNYDDNVYVYDNSGVQKGLSAESIAWAMSSPIGHWHPLTLLSFMLDVELFGVNAAGHHVVNVLFHVLNTLLLFLLLMRMTGGFWRSAAVAALFAIHPLHVEPVAWISSRKDVLSTFFWFLTLWAYASYVRRPNLRRYLCVVFCFALGLMAKSMLVTVPFLLLLLDFWPLGRLRLEAGWSRCWTLVREKLPLFACSGLSCLVAYYTGQAVGSVASFEAIPAWSRVTNAVVSYAVYIQKMFWPANLAVHYPHPQGLLPLWQFIAAGLFLTAVTFMAVRCRRQHPYLPVGWFWYLGTLVPVIGLVQIGGLGMADRYSYVSLVGLFIMVVWGLHEVAARWRVPQKALGVFGGVSILALAVCAWVQVGHWRDGETLCRHALRVTSNNARMHRTLGLALELQNDVEGAIDQFTKALAIRPDNVGVHVSWGVLLTRQRRFSEAAFHFAEVVRLKPNDSEARCNLGVALASKGDYEAACEQYRLAIQLEPGDPVTHFNLGLALANQGQLEKARAAFSRALELDPNQGATRQHLERIEAELSADRERRPH